MSPVRKNAILPSTKVSNTCSSVWTERCPNLNLDRVLAGSDERFDLEILLEHLEKAFNLPAGFINVADGLGIKIKVIRQQNQRSEIHHIADNHLSQSLRVFFAGDAKIDDFIAQDIAGILFQIKIRCRISCVVRLAPKTE